MPTRSPHDLRCLTPARRKLLTIGSQFSVHPRGILIVTLAMCLLLLTANESWAAPTGRVFEVRPIEPFALGRRPGIDRPFSEIPPRDLAPRDLPPTSSPQSPRDLLSNGFRIDPQRLIEMSQFDRPPEWNKDWSIETRTSYNSYGQGKQDAPPDLLSNFAPEDSQAIREFLTKNAELNRIRLDQWRTRTPASLGDIYKLITVSGQKLPGDQVELGLLLDPLLFHAPRETLSRAWGARPKSEIGLSLADEYFEGLKGKTVIVVGHVEGNNFVVRDINGKVSEWHSVPLLIEKAQAHGVFLVPVGCKSAEAGAPFGFMQDISTDQVADFLASLPIDKPSFGDLFQALREIGEIEVDFTRVEKYFEFAAIESPDTKPTTRFKVPSSYGLPQNTNPSLTPSANTLPQTSAATLPPASGLNSFAADISKEAEKYKPWWKLGRIGRLLAALDGVPWVFMGPVAGLLGCILFVAFEKISSWTWLYRNERRVKVARAFRRIAIASAFMSLLLIAAGALRAFIYGFYYGIFYFLCIIVLVTYLWSVAGLRTLISDHFYRLVVEVIQNFTQLFPRDWRRNSAR
jgi:hypothetical protein